MEIKKAFRFRLYPTREQVTMLLEWEGQLRFLWNLAHEQRVVYAGRPRHDRMRDAERGYRGPDYFSQSKEMTELCAEDARLAAVPSCCRQEVLRDLDKAWQRYRKGLGGRPRFKRRTDAMRAYAPDKNGWSLSGEPSRKRADPLGVLRFRKLGEIPIRLDRPIEGTPSSCTIVRDVGRSREEPEWYAVILCTVEIPDPKPSEKPAIGINRGVHVLVATSEGELIENPRPLEHGLKLLARRQRQAARKAPKPGQPASKNYRKALHKVARTHQKIRRRREHVLHEVSRRLVDNSSVIGIELFETKKMLERPIGDAPADVSRDVRRGIADSGWGMLGGMIQYKSEPTGCKVVRVPAVDLSRTCSKCDHVDAQSVRGREFRCTRCGHVEHVDVNTAKNAKKRALSALAAPPAPSKVRKTVKIPGRPRKGSTLNAAAKPAVKLPAEDPDASRPDEAGTSRAMGETRGHPPEES